MTLLPRLNRYLDLPAGDRRAFRHAWWLLLRYRLSFMLSPKERIGRRVAKAMSLPAGEYPSDAEGAAHWMAIMSQAARNHVLPMNCLVRAFAGRELLARRGVGSRVRIGVMREGGGALRAHAWLESGGKVVGDAADVASRFAPFDDVERLSGGVARWE